MNEFFKELQEENGLIKRTQNGAGDIDRILIKLDDLLSRNDYNGAEKLLEFSLNEADQTRQSAKKLAVLNEMTGLYRKTGQKEKAYRAAETALKTVSDESLTDTVTDATVLLNCATVFKSFDDNQTALDYYERARKIYERDLQKNDTRLAGLYNNEALALTALNNFVSAESFYKKALDIMLITEHGEPEAAVTCLNIADMISFRDGAVNGALSADEYVKRAAELLDSDNNLYDGNYAFVCEKCAPVFLHYGYFGYANELKQRSESIYERS